MRALVVLHVAAGTAGLLSGAFALAAAKGSELHRRSGRVFGAAMLLLSASGVLLALLRPPVIVLNVVSGALAFYLVATSLRTVGRPSPGGAWIDHLATTAAFAIGFASIAAAVVAVGNVAGRPQGEIAPTLMFGAVALFAAYGDLRVMAGRALEGRARLVRHLWRMCFALFMAAGSFFLGQAQLFPRPLRRSGLLALPVLLTLGVMVYWVVRLSTTRDRAARA